MLCDLQLGDKRVTLNHLEIIEELEDMFDEFHDFLWPHGSGEMNL